MSTVPSAGDLHSTVPGAAVPRCAPALITRDLPDGLLVFDPVRVRAHALNLPAAWIFHLCDGTASVDDIAAELAAVVDHDGSRRLDLDVREIIDHLTTEQVVAIDDRPRDPEPDSSPGFTNVPHTGEVAAVAAHRPWPFTSPRYVGLDFAFRFSTDDLELARYLTAILDPLADPLADPAGEPVAPSVAEHLYELATRSPQGLEDGLIALDGFVVSRAGSANVVAATLLWHLNQMVSTTSTGLLQLHASGVVRRGRAIVFPASMNSGKSTLVAGLLQSGDAYLTDETIAIDPATGVVQPYPKAIALDPGSWPVLPALDPRLDAVFDRFEHQKWHVDPRSTGAPLAGAAAVGAVVFPTYRPGEPTVSHPIGPSEAAVELCRNSFNLTALGAPGIDAIVDLVLRVPCHRLFVGDLDAAVRAIHGLVDAPGNDLADPAPVPL